MLIYDSDYKIEVHLFIVSTIPIPFDKREKKKKQIYILRRLVSLSFWREKIMW